MKNQLVINDLVGFKNMKIIQNKEYFNFSLDSIMLPNFIHFNKSIKTIIDFCTGNAPIPLVLSTKCDAKIIGVEIQKEIYDLANDSVKINKLEKQITIINEDVNNLLKIYDSDSIDMITCNPPYFKINDFTLRNNSIIKTNARHETLINIEQICNISKKLLKNNCSLYLVHKTDRLSEIFQSLKNNNLEPKRLRFIYPKINTESNIVLIEAKKNAKPGLIVESPIITHNNDGSYTKEVLDMFK